ncbi:MULTISPECIES: DUF4259 domain-containing protein [unclassified Streptomyces]|uniref:DUF4259 domain-containing protein n=1 Tax=unclassified Streptomyces TaxID=2593676 RepID=UPI000DAD2ADA|nr:MULTISPECIES: DUF4259 domain-containing protein [unclassified Streptomyces]PZT76627.1 hypothetical protein DNK56_25315 [Streptomyces sp. AC1-42W]PZT79416.1 hypothetical protein DNK55_07365 [Streptomyces sp. AC1-42T]
MGAWDVGPFDNDTAADWCGGLDDATPEERAEKVRAALAETADTTDYLDSDVADEAIAAAALVAAQCPGGAPVDSAYGPDEPLPDLTALRGLALQALDRVLTEPSEPLELWEETDEGPWHTEINRLREVLMPRP